MTTPADASGHPGLLNGLTDHHAVLLELFRQDRIQEGIAARVQWQNEDRKHLCLLQGNQMQSKGSGQRQESNRGPAEEVREHQQCHSLGNPRVIAVPRLRPPNGTVHLQVAAHEDEEGQPVDEHQEDHVGQTSWPRGRLKGQAHRKLPVVGDPKDGQYGHGQCKGPSDGHDVPGMPQRQSLVQVHRMGDRVVPLQRNHC